MQPARVVESSSRDLRQAATAMRLAALRGVADRGPTFF
jgi:hypothetical protein